MMIMMMIRMTTVIVTIIDARDDDDDHDDDRDDDDDDDDDDDEEHQGNGQKDEDCHDNYHRSILWITNGAQSQKVPGLHPFSMKGEHDHMLLP